MSIKFKCLKCNHDIFEDFGVIKFANNNFKVLKCLKCGNNSFLETKELVNNKNFNQSSSDLVRLSNKNT